MPGGFVVWLTGLSGAGKTTLAHEVAAGLNEAGCRVEVLDGDVVRQHLGQGLGFSRADRVAPGEIAINPMFFEHTFYRRASAGVAPDKTCPHDMSQHAALSGTQVRPLLRAGQPLPGEFTRPEVAVVLLEQMRAHQPAARA